MKILNSDSQYVFRIMLVEKLRFVTPNWNILFEITYESNDHAEDVFDLLF